LYPVSDGESEQIVSTVVGKKVDSVTCEVEGIILGLEMAI